MCCMDVIERYVLCGCGSEICAVRMWFRDMCCVYVIQRYVLCGCGSEICAVCM